MDWNQQTEELLKGLKMTAHKKVASHLQDNDQYLTPFPSTNTPLNLHRTPEALVDAVISEFNQSSKPSKEVRCDKPMRRRQ